MIKIGVAALYFEGTKSPNKEICKIFKKKWYNLKRY